jgi:DNA-dependent RNA polymerase auxiliary subunit epsilon
MMEFILSVIFNLVFGYVMYLSGRQSVKRELADNGIRDMMAKSIFPVGVLEKIDDAYYLYEKDTTNFLCQADRLEDIPINLYNNKGISLALIVYPEETFTQGYWCINGKLKKAT